MEHDTASPMTTLAEFVCFVRFTERECGGNGRAELALINHMSKGAQKISR